MNGYVMLVISQVMLGSVAVFARWAELPADLIVLFRCFFAAVCMGLVVGYRGKITQYFKWNRQLLLLLLTGVLMASNWYFFFKAVLSTSITNSILLYNLAPIFVLISAATVLKESTTVRQFICILVSFLGVSVIVGSGGGASSGLDQGCLYAICAAALYSQVTIIGRYLKSVPAAVITFFQTSVGAVLFLFLGFGHLQAMEMTWEKVAILVTMGVFHTAVPYLLYFKALKSVKAAIAGILQYVYTLSSIVFGIVFFREAVGVGTIVGGLMIVVASYVALRFPGSKMLLRGKSKTSEAVSLQGAPNIVRAAR